jgi:diaminopimelate epimerase
MKRQGNVIPFVKASACGNDFLIIDGQYAPSNLANVSRQLCDRHEGVGADGVEWLYPSAHADVKARLINADGSEAEISGNGTRCIAAYIYSEQGKQQISISTSAGVKTCALTSRSDTQYEFEIEMGEAKISDELTIKLKDREVQGIPVSMGNPHYVLFVEEFADKWQMEAADIQKQSVFPQGINVEFVKIVDGHNVEVRFFERGVGETQSSGTGSCASAVAAIFAKRTKSPVRVHAAGGTQIVRWEEKVFLRGSAQLICSGDFFVHT